MTSRAILIAIEKINVYKVFKTADKNRAVGLPVCPDLHERK